MQQATRTRLQSSKGVKGESYTFSTDANWRRQAFSEHSQNLVDVDSAIAVQSYFPPLPAEPSETLLHYNGDICVECRDMVRTKKEAYPIKVNIWGRALWEQLGRRKRKYHRLSLCSEA